MRKIGIPIFIVLLIGLDQLVKMWVVQEIPLNTVRSFIPNMMSLAYVRNYGAAYSILQNQQWFFIIVTVIAMTAAIWYLIKHIKGKFMLLWALSLVIAGGFGNFIDRLRLGYVVDMFHLDVFNFPVFNVADSYLTVGVVVLFICIMREEENGN